MRNSRQMGWILPVLVVVGLATAVFGEAAGGEKPVGGQLPFHTLLKDYDVRQIHAAACDVMFKSLSLAKVHPKEEDCNCMASRADALTGRIEATSADGIRFTVSIHYLDETTCGIWIHASQTSGVPADLAAYCQMIHDRTVQRLKQKPPRPADAAPTPAEPMEFGGPYEMSVEAMFSVMNQIANTLNLGHNIQTRNGFTVCGQLTSGQVQFSYKAYLVGDHKLKFRFWNNGSGTPDGDRYIYECVCREFEKILKQPVQ